MIQCTGQFRFHLIQARLRKSVRLLCVEAPIFIREGACLASDFFNGTKRNCAFSAKSICIRYTGVLYFNSHVQLNCLARGGSFYTSENDYKFWGVHLHMWQHLGMFLISKWVLSSGIPSQTSIKASVSSRTICDGTWLCWLHQFIRSYRRSFGFRSGEREGQSMASMPLSSRNCLHTLATWGQALSCTRRNPEPTTAA